MANSTEKTPKEIDEIIQNVFVNDYIEGYVDVGEEKTPMGKYYTEFQDELENFEVYDDDVYVASYLKTGTTWTQEMVWMIANNLDFEGAKVQIEERFPFIEFYSVFNYKKMDKDMDMETPKCVADSVNFCAKMARPRLIKTHLPLSLMPKQIRNGVKKPKIIYVVRNPKDVCVSYYHHGKYLHGWPATFDEFIDVYMSDKIMWGSFWKHALGYWNQRNSLNMLVITYEEMKKDLAVVIRKVAKFLEKEVTDEQVNVLLHHLSFETMKKNQSVNYEQVIEVRRKHKFSLEGTFMRSGTVGSYKKEMTPEHLQRMAAWTKKYTENTDFAKTYPYLVEF